MANNMDGYGDPVVKQRLLKSLMSGSKQKRLKQQSQPAEEPENVYTMPEPQVEYQDIEPQAMPNEFVNPIMEKQIQQWEDNYTPEDESENTEEDEQTSQD